MPSTRRSPRRGPAAPCGCTARRRSRGRGGVGTRPTAATRWGRCRTRRRDGRRGPCRRNSLRASEVCSCIHLKCRTIVFGFQMCGASHRSAHAHAHLLCFAIGWNVVWNPNSIFRSRLFPPSVPRGRRATACIVEHGGLHRPSRAKGRLPFPFNVTRDNALSLLISQGMMLFPF